MSASSPITACTFGKRSVYCSGSGCSERIFSQRKTSGLASMSADTQSTGKSEIENTHGLTKIRCRRPISSRSRTRFSLGHGSASTVARTFAATAGSCTSASPPP